MKIVFLGAGVQGTLYGVRLARAGHEVTLVARESRARELRDRGAIVEQAFTLSSEVAHLPVADGLHPDTVADLCFVAVRREQMADALRELGPAIGIARFVFMVNHANGSEAIFDTLGRQRVILGFPGAAGGMSNGTVRFVEIAEQPTVIEANAPDVGAIVRAAGFRVELVRDMDSWLRRHAVFVTAIAGALYGAGSEPKRLALDLPLMRTFILAIREGWSALDRRGVAVAALPLRAIFTWVPLPLAIAYWRRLLQSPRGEWYFARHARHAPKELAALAADVRSLIENDAVPNLERLYASIDTAARV